MSLHVARGVGAPVAWLAPLALAAAAAGWLAGGRDLGLGAYLSALLALAAGLFLLHSLIALHLRQTAAFLAGLELAYGLLLLLRSHSAPLLGSGLPEFARLQAVSIPLALILVYALGRGSPQQPRGLLCAGLIVTLPLLGALALQGLPDRAAAVLDLRLMAVTLAPALPQVGLVMLAALALLLALRRDRSLYELCLAAVLLPRYLLLQQAAGVLRAGFPARATLAAILLLLALLYGLYRLFWERAFLDELTGLGNRRSLEDALRALPRRFVLAMIDLDHFKAVNDTYGHAEGDNVLRWVASHVKRAFGPAAFRYGGEEFAVLLPETAPQTARARLEGLRRSLAQAKFVVRRGGPDRRGSRRRRTVEQERRSARGDRRSGERVRRRGPAPSGPGGSAGAHARRLQITVSIGLSAASGGSERPQEVLLRADAALYRAKQTGRNRVVVAGEAQSGPRGASQGRSSP